MCTRILHLCIALLLLCKGSSLYSQSYPGARSSPSQGEDLYSTIQQLKTNLANTKHTLSNHETEIRMFENKLSNQENTFEHLQQQLKNEMQSNIDSMKATKYALEDKYSALDQTIKNLEAIVNGTVADLRQFVAQANDSVALLAQHEKKITKLEQTVEKQGLYIQKLETVIESMMELIQIKDNNKAPLHQQAQGNKTYKVQAGDILGEIARKHQIPLQTLRDANPQITNDRIVIGQIIKIPEKPA